MPKTNAMESTNLKLKRQLLTKTIKQQTFHCRFNSNNPSQSSDLHP